MISCYSGNKHWRGCSAGVWGRVSWCSGSTVLLVLVSRWQLSSPLVLATNVMAFTHYVLPLQMPPPRTAIWMSLATDPVACVGWLRMCTPPNFLEKGCTSGVHFWLTVGWAIACTATLPVGTRQVSRSSQIKIFTCWVISSAELGPCHQTRQWLQVTSRVCLS